MGRTIAQAVNRRLPNALARVGSQVRSGGICGGQSGRRAGSPSTSVSLASHSTDCSTDIIIHHPALVQ
jgi:hypothetical protein